MVTTRYLKNYRFRIKNILLVLVIEAFLIVPVLFFESPTITRAFQMESDYCSYSYNFGYELNYETGLSGEMIYPQGSINFYKDEGQTQRIIVNSVMRKEASTIDCLYSNSFFAQLKTSTDIIIPSNIASKYSLKKENHIFAVYPYSNSIIEMKIVDIGKSLYDFSDNAYANNLGLVIVGYDSLFASLTNYNYVLLASNSQAKVLSNFPQAIRSTFNKQQILVEAQKSLGFPFLLNLILSLLDSFLFYVLLDKKTIGDAKLLFKYNTSKVMRLFLIKAEWLCLLYLPSIILVWLAYLFIKNNPIQYLVFSLSYLGIICLASTFNAIFLTLKWRNMTWKK